MQLYRAWRPVVWGVGLAVVPAAGALAADPSSGAPSTIIFVAQIVVLILVGRLLGEVMQRIGQPAVMGQLVGGMLLGPSVFGALLAGGAACLVPDGRRPEEHDRCGRASSAC